MRVITTFFVIVLCSFFLIGCVQEEFVEIDKGPELPTASDAECLIDADCATGGCSSQICTTTEKAIDIISTCEFKAEYECLQLTSCSCNQGKCGWAESVEYTSCLEEKKNS